MKVVCPIKLPSERKRWSTISVMIIRSQKAGANRSASPPMSRKRHGMQIANCCALAFAGYDVKRSERPNANLVFLVDVSGSMGSRNKLPLVKSTLNLLADQLNPKDRVSIVVYSGTVRPTARADIQQNSYQTGCRLPLCKRIDRRRSCAKTCLFNRQSQLSKKRN